MEKNNEKKTLPGDQTDRNGSDSGSRGGGKFPLTAGQKDGHGTNKNERKKPAAGRTDTGTIGAPGAGVKLRYRPDKRTRPSGDLGINKTRSRTGRG